VRGSLRTVFAMKRQGLRRRIRPDRNGEWEYLSYTPDGAFATAPAASGACALCHMQATSAALSNICRRSTRRTITYSRRNFLTGASGATPDGVNAELFVRAENRTREGPDAR